jgi:hypothetical protein
MEMDNSMFSWTPSRDGENEDTDVEDLVLEMRRVELELLLVKLKQKLRKFLLFDPPDR